MGIETLVLKKHRYSQGLSRKKNIDYDITSITGLHNNDDNFSVYIITAHTFKQANITK